MVTVSDAAGATDTTENILGPRPGFSPHIGTLVSEMTWMRDAVVRSISGLNSEQLDYLLDRKANTIGALLLHLAATERLYQLNTFDQMPFGEIARSAAFRDWNVAMELGEPARQSIKGKNLDFYLVALHAAREKTLSEFRKRDDAWLMAVDKTWGWGPTNNLCKWFHVCEHESHHTGQIALLRGRVPGS